MAARMGSMPTSELSIQPMTLPDGRRLDLYVSGPDDGLPFVWSFRDQQGGNG